MIKELIQEAEMIVQIYGDNTLASTFAQKIINHYKRAFDLEFFRDYMKNFHLRIAKLPKNPKVKKSIKHKEYLLEVARLFDITPEKPFSGKFYFETLKD